MGRICLQRINGDDLTFARERSNIVCVPVHCRKPASNFLSAVRHSQAHLAECALQMNDERERMQRICRSYDSRCIEKPFVAEQSLRRLGIAYVDNEDNDDVDTMVNLM